MARKGGSWAAPVGAGAGAASWGPQKSPLGEGRWLRSSAEDEDGAGAASAQCPPFVPPPATRSGLKAGWGSLWGPGGTSHQVCVGNVGGG